MQKFKKTSKEVAALDTETNSLASNTHTTCLACMLQPIFKNVSSGASILLITNHDFSSCSSSCSHYLIQHCAFQSHRRIRVTGEKKEKMV